MWEGLVAANVSPLTGLTSVAGLGVALARGTTTWAGHVEDFKESS